MWLRQPRIYNTTINNLWSMRNIVKHPLSSMYSLFYHLRFLLKRISMLRILPKVHLYRKRLTILIIPGVPFTNMDYLKPRHGLVMTYPVKCGMKSPIHSTTSTIQPLNFGNFVPHAIMDIFTYPSWDLRRLQNIAKQNTSYKKRFDGKIMEKLFCSFGTTASQWYPNTFIKITFYYSP